jgi:short-subunit dehydrogenase
MRALITGGTSGIGLAMARELLKRGYDVYLVSRNPGESATLQQEYPTRKVVFLSHDLSQEEECYRLIKETEGILFDLYLNNAGFGDIGHFDKTDLTKEITMVKLNDIATLILTKAFLERFTKQNKGRILVTCSAAAFGPAPYMTVYYSTKAFAYYLVHGYHRELKERKSAVTISALCPGPVRTGFEKGANARFNMKAMAPEKVARIAIKGLLKGKLEIVPGLWMKLAHVGSHLVPKRLISIAVHKSTEIAS